MTKIKIKIKGLPGDRAIHGQFPNLNSTWTNNGSPSSDEALSDPEVTHTVKPIDREHANIEAEKGELLLKPDLMGLYKIQGNPHSKGGTPLNVPDGSFIFSKDNSLAMTKGEMDMFDFKRTSNKKKDNTPAMIAEREVSAKNYNQHISTLDNSSKDSIAKNTAALMLAKYQEKLGQIALVQEGKKGLPSGMPDFAADAPMTNAQKEAQLSSFKRGGIVLPTFQSGGTNKYYGDSALNARYLKHVATSKYKPGYLTPQDSLRMALSYIAGDKSKENDDVFSWFSNSPASDEYDRANGIGSGNKDVDKFTPLNGNNGRIPASGVPRTTNNPTNRRPIFTNSWAAEVNNPFVTAANTYRSGNTTVDSPQHRRGNGMFGEQDWDMNDFQKRHSWFTDANPNFNPKDESQVRQFQSQYNQRANELFGRSYFDGNGFRAVDGKFGEYTFNAPNLNRAQLPTEREGLTPPAGPVNRGITLPPARNIEPNVKAGEIPWEGYNLDMTPLEKLTGAMPALIAYSTPTHYAMLEQKHTPGVRLDRLNNTQELSDIQSSNALASREMFGNMSGNQAAGNMDAVRANSINMTGQSNARMDQGNMQIGNQETQMNDSRMQSDLDWNLNQVLQTYDKNVLANQRKHELRANGVAQSLNNFSDIEQNIQALEYGATAAAFPYLTHEKNADGTERIYTGADGKRYVRQGVPFGFNDRRMPMFQPGFGDLNSFGVQAQMAGNQGTLGALQAKYMEAIEAGDSKMAYAISQGMKSLSSESAQRAYSNPIMAMLQSAIGPRTR